MLKDKEFYKRIGAKGGRQWADTHKGAYPFSDVKKASAAGKLGGRPRKVIDKPSTSDIVETKQEQV